LVIFYVEKNLATLVTTRKMYFGNIVKLFGGVACGLHSCIVSAAPAENEREFESRKSV
jgi:hypothetical protein